MWQAMDTAPKTERILAYFAGRSAEWNRVHVIWWDRDFHISQPYAERGQWVTYGEVGKIGFSPGGWQPLPVPPRLGCKDEK